MDRAEKTKRIIQTINDVEWQLEKAVQRYNCTIDVLKMEIKENGSNKELNMPWVEYALQDKNEVCRYKMHIDRLSKMLLEL